MGNSRRFVDLLVYVARHATTSSIHIYSCRMYVMMKEAGDMGNMGLSQDTLFFKVRAHR